MLFSRIFNWVKYKTLPPSLLFLNRLFVERDSKHRRLLSNLGLTFRNSKWSMYSRINVNEITRAWFYSYWTATLSMLFLLIIIGLLPIYYDSIIWFEDVVVPLWFVYDFELYFTACYTFFYSLLLQLTFSFIQVPFFNTWYQLNHESKIERQRMGPQLVIPTRLHKSILYRWSTNAVNPTSLAQLFRSQNTTNECSTELFYQTLYQIVGILSVDKLIYTSSLNTNRGITNNLGKSACLASTLHQSAYYPLTASYKFSDTGVKVSESLKEFNYWNLYSINIEWSRYSSKLSFQPFYLTHLTYNDITKSMVQNTELTTLSHIVGHQLSLREWHQWLYKYNLLHRGVLQDSLCVSLMKQLIAPSFYNSTAFSRNMWASSITPYPIAHSSNTGNYYEALYGNSSLSSLITFLKKDLIFHTANDVDQIMFYSTSYNWFLQRFYNFNTLLTNCTTWNSKLSPLTCKPQSVVQKGYSISMLNFSWSLNKNQYTYETPFSEVPTCQPVVYQTKELQPYHDVYLSYFDYTIFSKLNSETALSLTVNQGSPILKFFNVQNIIV